MTVQQLAGLVKTVRNAQRSYDRTQTTAVFLAMLAAERELDDVVDAILSTHRLVITPPILPGVSVDEKEDE